MIFYYYFLFHLDATILWNLEKGDIELIDTVVNLEIDLLLKRDHSLIVFFSYGLEIYLICPRIKIYKLVGLTIWYT